MCVKVISVCTHSDESGVHLLVCALVEADLTSVMATLQVFGLYFSFTAMRAGDEDATDDDSENADSSVTEDVLPPGEIAEGQITTAMGFRRDF